MASCSQGRQVVKPDDIVLVAPLPNSVVTSPLAVTGEARGFWFFEASFPVRLLDGNGNIMAEVPAQAQGEWMTENFVPFAAELDFSAPATSTGTLVLEKQNAAGLPNPEQMIVPVRF